MEEMYDAHVAADGDPAVAYLGCVISIAKPMP